MMIWDTRNNKLIDFQIDYTNWVVNMCDYNPTPDITPFRRYKAPLEYYVQCSKDGSYKIITYDESKLLIELLY